MLLLHPRSPTPESPKWKRMLFIHTTDSDFVPGTVHGAGMQTYILHPLLTERMA